MKGGAMQDRKPSRLLSLCVLTLAVAAITAPMAQARHAPAEVKLGTTTAGYVDAATRHHHPDVVQPPTRIVAVARAGDFDWGDAGIGAGGALGVVLLAGGSALLLKRNRPRLRWMFFTVVFCSLLGTGLGNYADANANSNPATFTDPNGDSGTAPDIANVVVSNDANGQLRFRINVAKLSAPSPVNIVVAIDSDQNEATGMSGTDYLLVADLSTSSFGAARWNGADFVDSAAATASANNDSAGITFSINRRDLGNASGLNFWVRAFDGPEPVAGHFDDAPDQGTWNYTLVSPAQIQLAVVGFLAPKSVKAGKTLTAVMAATRSDTGDLVGKEGRVQCRATIGGKPLRLLASGFVRVGSQSGAGCAWRVPRNAHRKTIRGSVTIGFQGATVSRQFAAKVR
jgi:hypothetical protein